MLLLNTAQLDDLKVNKANLVSDQCRQYIVEAYPYVSNEEIAERFNYIANLCMNGNIQQFQNILFLFSQCHELLSNDSSLNTIISSSNLIERAKMFHVKRSLGLL